MILKIFSVRDTKSEIYNRPWYMSTHGEAERAFKDLANDSESQIGRHPEDYDMYYLGKYDDNTGKFEPNETPEHVVKAVNLVKRPVLANTDDRQEVLPLNN